jgi:hypothetical protein
MKKIILLSALFAGVISLNAQASKADLLQNLEKNQISSQSVTTTATLKSSSRLFSDKNDLTSVILIIPSGSTVTVLGSDSTYLHVTFEENDGYIFKRQAVIDVTPVNNQQVNQPQQPTQAEKPAQVEEQQVSRFTELENKYGSNMAARLISGKIWKGMNAEMVSDSWGKAERINRVVSRNVIKEEWIFKNTWLYFENNVLVEWGPIRK